MKSKGLGDSIEKITKATGIDKVAKFILGEDCGCQARQEKLKIWKALEQSRNDAPRGKTPLVVFTKNFQLDYCAIEFNDFINILLELEEFRNQKNL